MRYEEQDRPTWDGEALAEALGRELSRLRDDLWTHERFLRWLAADMRAQTERRTTASQREAALLERGRALHARLLARRCGVWLVDTPPRLVSAPHRVTPMQAMDDARAMHAAPRVELAAAAGAGRALWDEPSEHWIALPPVVPRMRALALRVEGESMAPLIRSGDTVLVELGAPLVRGRIVVARNADDGYVCKRVDRIGRHAVGLASLNPAYENVIIPRDERRIVGTVRMVWRA
jgi:SOS-response transcriptional repressor LexA